MTKAQRKTQRNLKKITNKKMLINIIICAIIITISFLKPTNALKVGKSKVESEFFEVIDEVIDVDVAATEYMSIEQPYPNFTYSKDWDVEESYLLAKIAMAEAEGCDLKTKCYIILTVLNRVWDEEFPNTIEEVIYEKRGGVCQFTPIGDGRWDKVKPNEECWLAVEMVMSSEYDFSEGALYFENCRNEDNWHSRNLQFLYESDGMRFYK